MLGWYRARGKSRRVLVDFDGVIHHYEAWNGNTPTGAAIKGSIDALATLKNTGWEVVIFTARPTRPTKKWLDANGFTGLYARVSNVKWPARAQFDDLAIHVPTNLPFALHNRVNEWLKVNA